MPSQPRLILLLVTSCYLVTACDTHQSNNAQSKTAQDTTVLALTTASTTNLSATTIQSLNSVASVPVIDTSAPRTMTMVTSISSTVAVPVHITAGAHPDAQAVAELGTLGHTEEAIALTNTMLDGIGQGLQATNADVAFVKCMIAHHEGAIALAQIELKYGKDDTLRKLAQDIIIMRSNEIRWMMSWLDSNAKLAQQIASAPTALQQEPQYTDGLKEMYHQMLEGISQDNPDVAFAQSMIPHHKGALAMAQVEFKYGNDDKIRELADSIIGSQQGEITLLQQWLKAHPLNTITP